MTAAQTELNQWWTSLPVANKEFLSKQPYPTCSAWWIALTEAEQSQLKQLAETRNKTIV